MNSLNFQEAVHFGAEIYHNLENLIKEKHGKDAFNVGDEEALHPTP